MRWDVGCGMWDVGGREASQGCRCEALRSPAEQSEAIYIGIASTKLPTNDNDHGSNLGSVLVEAIPLWIAVDCYASHRNASQRQFLPLALLQKIGIGYNTIWRICMCTYFEHCGPDNTAEVLHLAKKRAEELSIKTILVATTKGATGEKASLLFKEYHLIAVTHSTGFNEPNKQELLQEHRQNIISNGGAILTCQHAFGGVARAVRRTLKTYQLDEIIAYTLRTFGQGTKVAVEIALMAADAGMVRTDQEVISIGGSDNGADTALVLTPTNAQDFFSLKIHEIICKPRSW